MEVYFGWSNDETKGVSFLPSNILTI